MKTKTVSSTVYVCENCGHTTKDKLNIFKCPISHKEICNKCAKKVRLVDRTIYDFQDYADLGSKTVLVHEDVVKATELDMEYDYEHYIKAVVEARKQFMQVLDEIDKAYLEGTMIKYNETHLKKDK